MGRQCNSSIYYLDYLGLFSGEIDLAWGVPLLVTVKASYESESDGKCNRGNAHVEASIGIGASAKVKLGNFKVFGMTFDVGAGFVAELIGLSYQADAVWCLCDDGTGHGEGTYDIIDLVKRLDQSLAIEVGGYGGEIELEMNAKIGLAVKVTATKSAAFVEIGMRGNVNIKGAAHLNLGIIELGKNSSTTIFDESYEHNFWEGAFHY